MQGFVKMKVIKMWRLRKCVAKFWEAVRVNARLQGRLENCEKDVEPPRKISVESLESTMADGFSNIVVS